MEVSPIYSLTLISPAEFSVHEIAVACEAADKKLQNELRLTEDKSRLLKAIEELELDPSVKFLRRVGQADLVAKTKAEKTEIIESSKGINGLYSVNWEELHQVVQITFVEQVVERTAHLGVYHARVLRILKAKGHLLDHDIGQMSLLPPRDTRAVINQLIKEGLITHVQVPTSQNKQTIAAGASQLMYGLNQAAARKVVCKRIMQAIVNLCMRHYELGRIMQVTREFNTLYF